MFKPEGVYFAMVTPFENGKINEKVLRQLVEFDIQKGVKGLFPVSTSGEFIQMDFAQKVQMMEIVFDQAAGRVAVTPGVTEPNPQKTIALAKEAKRIGCNAVVVSVPYYIPITQGMVQAHMEMVARGVDMPIILYNIPSFTTPISLGTFENLLKIPNIVGMKDSTGSAIAYLHMMDKIRLAGRKDTFSFFTGSEDAFLPSLASGACGCVTGASGIVPEIMVGIWDNFMKGDYDKALKLQYTVLEMIRTWAELPLPVSLKTALKVRGFDMGEPVQPLSKPETAHIKVVSDRLGKLMCDALGDSYKVDVDQLL